MHEKIDCFLDDCCLPCVVDKCIRSLKITSFPSGAKVAVDGVDTENSTPMSIPLLEGVHTVTVHIPGSGWSVENSDVTIVSGDNYLSVNLAPMFASGAE